MHLDDERLERLIDGELPSGEETDARAHLEQCAECRRRMADAERERADVKALLAAVDGPAPRVDFAEITRRAEDRPERAPRRMPWGLPRWAAALAVVAGVAGAAYALPGSPVRGWVEKVAAWAQGLGEGPRAADEPDENPDPSVAGVAVDPGVDFVVEFRPAAAEESPAAPRRDGRLAVALTDDETLHVHAPRGAATFTSLEARLLVEDHGDGATFEIDVPRVAPRVEIRVGDRLVFLKEGDRVTAPGTSGPPPYVLPMAPPGR